MIIFFIADTSHFMSITTSLYENTPMPILGLTQNTRYQDSIVKMDKQGRGQCI